MDFWKIVRPWLDSREKWQEILDSTVPNSAEWCCARERLDWIDNQLSRAFAA